MHGKSHNNTEPLSTTATQVASDASYHGSANSSSGSSNYGSTVEHGVTSYGAADVCPCCAGVFHQGLPPAYHNPDHKPILAERFKTKMCRNYEQTGVCPYVHRCMFAHGEHELRTKHMNLADGLVTEEAIKNFKRANYEAHRAASMYGLGDECSSMRSTPPPPMSMRYSHDGLSYRHDPYAQYSLWRPISPTTPVYPSSVVLPRSGSPSSIVEAALATLEVSPASSISSLR